MPASPDAVQVMSWLSPVFHTSPPFGLVTAAFGAGIWMKVAVTDLLEFITMTIGLALPLASPDQADNFWQGSFGTAVKVTDVPPLYDTWTGETWMLPGPKTEVVSE